MKIFEYGGLMAINTSVSEPKAREEARNGMNANACQPADSGQRAAFKTQRLYLSGEEMLLFDR